MLLDKSRFWKSTGTGFIFVLFFLRNPNFKKLIDLHHLKSKNDDDIEGDLEATFEEFKKNESLFNVFRLDNEEGEGDFEVAILHTFLNCN